MLHPYAFPYILSLVPCISSTSALTFEEHSRGLEQVLWWNNNNGTWVSLWNLYTHAYIHAYTGSEQNPRLLEILLEIPLGVLAGQPTSTDWLDL